MTLSKLIAILKLIAPLGGAKVTIAIAILEIVSGGELSFGAIADHLGKYDFGADAEKIKVGIQVLKILDEN